MHHIALTEPMTPEFVDAYIHEHGLPEPLAGFLAHHVEQPQEDFFAVAPTAGTFVVADGVTLDVKALIEHGQRYPHPSPSGAVAHAFCRAVAEQGGNTNMLDMFHTANSAVENIATGEGCTYAGNPTNRFAATAAYVTIEHGAVHWASICDSYVAHFDTSMKLLHHSSGTCEPYAVVNGEEQMAQHLERGTWHAQSGDTIFLTTDGFIPYLTDTLFLPLFADETLPTQEDIKQYTAKKNREDPLQYGHERTLIAVRL